MAKYLGVYQGETEWGVYVTKNKDLTTEVMAAMSSLSCGDDREELVKKFGKKITEEEANSKNHKYVESINERKEGDGWTSDYYEFDAEMQEIENCGDTDENAPVWLSKHKVPIKVQEKLLEEDRGDWTELETLFVKLED